MTVIGKCSFSVRKNLQSVVIPHSVQSIEKSAFHNCDGLQTVSIGRGMKAIKNGAFAGCCKLNAIQFAGTVAEWHAIRKVRGWDIHTGNFIVICTNGKIAKDGTVTMN